MARSFSPVGKTMPISKERLKYKPSISPVNPEKVIMRRWAKENTRRPHINCGGIPLDSILHECNPECDPDRGRHSYTGKFDDRDIRAAAAVVQWIATNCGRSFFHEFEREVERAFEKHLPKKLRVA
jgi:hypothetical protein